MLNFTHIYLHIYEHRDFISKQRFHMCGFNFVKRILIRIHEHENWQRTPTEQNLNEAQFVSTINVENYWIHFA